MASENGRYRGLLVDYGGVLTSDLFDSFRSFCALEGLEPDDLRRRFREDRECRALLLGLETGKLEETHVERELAQRIGVDPEDLIDRLFAHSGPDAEMIGAVRSAHEQGIRTGLISNSWGTRRYDREELGRLFDAVVISGEVGIRKPAPEIYELGAKEVGLSARAVKAARSELADEHARLERMFLDARIGMVLVDDDGRWVRVNPAVCAMLGYSQEELENSSFPELTHQADLRDVNRTNQGKEFEKRYITRERNEIWALVNVSPITEWQRGARFQVVQIQDITERKRAERAFAEERQLLK